jgi:pectate lyase
VAVLVASGGLLLDCGDVHVYPILPETTDGGDATGGLPCGARPLVGFATLPPGTTGGAAGATVTVRSLDDLQKYLAMTDPLTIQIDGLIAVAGQLDVTSDKTIVGIGSTSGLTGGGFRLRDGHNVIFQNLVIAKAVGTDAIQLQTAVNVWVDHCDLSSDRDNGKEYYDGLVDISHACDAITVSWTRFHDHFHCSLVGHSADNGAEDMGHLTVTYHHNLFEQTSSELPRVRFGSVHVFNNHYRNIDIYAIASQMSAAMLVERNLFENVTMPLLTHYEDPEDGTMHQVGNAFVDSDAPQDLMDTTWTPPYVYDGALDLVDSVAAVVDACAGVGKI